MSELFPIMIEVDDGDVGKTVRALNGMPEVKTIHLQMNRLPQQDRPAVVGPKQPPILGLQKQRGRRIINGDVGSVRSLVANAMSQGAIHYKIMQQVLKRAGLSPVSVHSAITKMVADKTIQRVAPGTYRLTSRGERKYLQHTNPRQVHASTAGGLIDNKKGLRALILTALVSNNLNQSELKNVLIENDYSANNMYNIVLRMREEGLIHKEDDIYNITEKGREALAPETPSLLLEHNADDTEQGDTV